MKNFLFKTKTRFALVICSLAALAFSIAATPFGDIQMNLVSGRLPRLGMGVDIVQNVGYQFNGKGRLLFRSPGTQGDSSTLEIDSNEINIANTTSAGVAQSSILVSENGYVRVTGRLSTPLGANVASASSLVLGKGSEFQITGTTGVTLIDTTNFTQGDCVTLWFNGSLTVSDSTARSGVYAPINLAGGSNLSATKNDALCVCLRRDIGASATQSEWFEKSRTVNAD